MRAFRWLHFSDLHQGHERQASLWPNFTEKLDTDLKRLHEKQGPWHAVLFTGDLTQKGDQKEFQRVSAFFDKLWGTFEKLGFCPQLLAVPGNHDLTRPKKPERSLEVTALRYAWNTDEVQHTFWENRDTPCRRLIDASFLNYSKWWKAQSSRRPAGLQQGVLRGDFAATLDLGTLRVGIVGLNSAFLQLTAGDYRGKLALGREQFHKACGDNGAEWAKAHDICLLMSHHPPEWLDERSNWALSGDIASPGRFAVHLYGHMHKGDSQFHGERGEKPRCRFQGYSLFGLEETDDVLERRHGYAGGSIELQPGGAQVRFWPRAAKWTRTGPWGIERDGLPTFFLKDEDGGTEPWPVSIIPPAVTPPPVTSLPPAPTPPPVLPGNHLLIPTKTPFNKLCHDVLWNHRDRLGIKVDLFEKSESNSRDDYVAGWECFLGDEHARWLFVNHPERGLSQPIIRNYVKRMHKEGKRAVFFESGQEFLKEGESLGGEPKQLLNPVTVIQTDSEGAIQTMMSQISRTTFLGRRRETLFILLIPGPDHPMAHERQESYLRVASMLAQQAVLKQLTGHSAQNPQFPPGFGFLEPKAVALFAVSLDDWTRECARDTVKKALPHLATHCLRADYLMLYGNDDIALGVHDAICQKRDEGCARCSDTKTVMVGFDGLEEMIHLVEKGKAITARADLNAMMSHAQSLIGSYRGARPPDGRIRVPAKVIPT